MKFEATWQEDWKRYVRLLDEDSNKSVVKEIPNKTEYYVPDTNGYYKYILDQSQRMQRKLGSAKDAREQYGVRPPHEVYIRDNYWRTGYNMKPRIWYLDIETRSNCAYKTKDYDYELIEIRSKGSNNSVTLKVLELKNHKNFSSSKCSKYEYKDKITGTWYPLDKHKGFETYGFPEPDKALEEITLIQIFDSALNAMLVLGTREYIKEEGYDLEYQVKYIQCQDEIDLLNKYCQLFKKLDPLVIYAWNGGNFDYPYIYNRLKNLGLDPNLMSNYGTCELHPKLNEVTKQLEYKFNTPGHYYIDMLVAYKKRTFGAVASYALDFIANKELGEGKVDHSEFTTFDSFYTGEGYQISKEPYDDRVREEIRQLKIKEDNNTLDNNDKVRLQQLLQFQFVYYGIKDVYLLKRLDMKVNLTNIMMSMAQTMGCEPQDTLATLKPWACYIANVCYEQGLALPKKSEHENPNIIGGFVRDPIVGKHEWVLSEDYNSMYPLNIIGFGMSPDTFIPLAKAPSDLRSIVMQYFNDQDEDRVLSLPQEVWEQVTALLQKYQMSMGINGALFDVSKEGIVPNLVWQIYTQRKSDKKTMLKYEKQKEIIADIMSHK